MKNKILSTLFFIYVAFIFVTLVRTPNSRLEDAENPLNQNRGIAFQNILPDATASSGSSPGLRAGTFVKIWEIESFFLLAPVHRKISEASILGDRVVTTDDSGRVFAIDASGRKEWRFEPLRRAGESLVVYPSQADGSVYLTTSIGRVYKFSLLGELLASTFVGPVATGPVVLGSGQLAVPAYSARLNRSFQSRIDEASFNVVSAGPWTAYQPDPKEGETFVCMAKVPCLVFGGLLTFPSDVKVIGKSVDRLLVVSMTGALSFWRLPTRLEPH